MRSLVETDIYDKLCSIYIFTTKNLSLYTSGRCSGFVSFMAEVSLKLQINPKRAEIEWASIAPGLYLEDLPAGSMLPQQHVTRRQGPLQPERRHLGQTSPAPSAAA